VLSTRRRAGGLLDVGAYYDQPAVRRRLLEYCGADRDGRPTAAYVATLQDDQHPFLTWTRSGRVPPAQFDALCAERGDLSRSAWDTRNLIFIVDLDHQNIDAPWEPFLHPADAFLTLEPVYRVIRSLLRSYGIDALDLMTGRGYHFVGRVPLEHPVVDRLAALLSETPSWYATLEQRRPGGVSARMDARQATAWSALGLLIEHLAHDTLRRTSRRTRVPVVLNGTIVGTGALGRECVSVDFSQAGDPLDARHIRMAYGAYQWHRLRPDIFGGVAASLPPLVALPRRARPLLQLLESGRTLAAAAAQAARDEPVTLPDVSRGIARLLASYVTSPLAGFHREFYAEAGTPPPFPTVIEDLGLPPCLAACLRTPNDLLLRPEHLQYLTRGLVMRGWRPSQIARLVRNTYEADHHWGDRWTLMNPRSRAEFDVRVFAGLLATGLDRMVDHNCVSAQQKGVCPGTGCTYDLRIERDRFLSRGSS
jgi:hypothetical protein